MSLKLIRVTTISLSLNVLLKGQLSFLNRFYEVIGIASDREMLDEVAKREGIRTIVVAMKREISLWSDFKSLIHFVWIFWREKPFIVHANTPKASLLVMLAAWMMQVPNRIYTVTGLRFETTTGIFRKFLILLEKVTCFCATKVIPEGEGVKKALLKERITTKPLKVIFNGNINGVNCEFFKRTQLLEEQAMDIKSEGYTFCFVGRIVKDKGINELIHAFVILNDKYPNTHLIMVGSLEKELDPLLPDVESLLLKHNSISFVGFQQDIRPYLQASDVFVFPSYREGFPNVVLQAGAMELPSIVTDINGSNEIIENGVNGKIIPPKDEKALYEAMKWFYEHREDVVLEMAKKTRPIVMERYEQYKVWEALLKEYQSLE